VRPGHRCPRHWPDPEPELREPAEGSRSSSWSAERQGPLCTRARSLSTGSTRLRSVPAVAERSPTRRSVHRWGEIHREAHGRPRVEREHPDHTDPVTSGSRNASKGRRSPAPSACLRSGRGVQERGRHEVAQPGDRVGVGISRFIWLATSRCRRRRAGG
jgi:hypothetical protein